MTVAYGGYRSSLTIGASMGFSLFLAAYTDGQPHGVPAGRLRELFGEHLDAKSEDLWGLRYDELNSVELYIGRRDSLVDSITVERPCQDMRLWNALFGVLELGNFVLYFPGDEAPMIASAGVRDHLPTDMIDTLGEPNVVRSAEEIVARVCA